MKKELIHLIQQEDKKNPYTDEQLANLLGMRRELVTSIRNEEGIQDSRGRRKEILLEAINKEIFQQEKISERELTRRIKEQGFQVSRHLIREYRKEILDHPPATKSQKTQKCPWKEEVPQGKQACLSNEAPKIPPYKETAFDSLIGAEGSLKPFVQQAKAAVLYPPNGLHTLILGPSGVGKSDLANVMYEFAKESSMIQKDAPFVIFNCADYADNPQLLMSQLFGYVKGAFTGAEKDKAGLVERADGSILFLDEVHRLPPEGQELLFYLIDKGHFRRLGETETERRVKIMIIAATTEDPDSMLLVTFRRRIPMVVELPSLDQRPLEERLAIIRAFFKKESHRTQSTIEIANEALKALLLYDCPGNVGQLRSDIQVSSAKSFLNQVVNKSPIMKVTTEELPVNAKKGLLKTHNYRVEIEGLIGNDSLTVQAQDEPYKESVYEDLYTLPEEIYEHIEERYYELQSQGMDREVINYVIGSEIEGRLKSIVEKIGLTSRPLEKKDLMKIVGIEIVNVVEKILKIAQRKLGYGMENLYYVLSVHLSTTIERIRQGKSINNPQLKKIKREYSKEFQIAKEMTQVIEKELGIKLPEDEVAFITMYLRMMSEKEEVVQEGRIGVVVVSHGHVAEGMADVANRLLGVVHAKSVEMSLDESPESALKRVIEVSKRADEGKGVLLLVDMGSLVTFGEIITERTGIKTRILTRTDTVKVIEVVRRALLPGVNIDEIADALEETPKYISRLGSRQESPSKHPKMIVTMCITGQGAALKIKELLENLIPGIEKDVNIVPIGAIDDHAQEMIREIGQNNEILAIVGTMDPRIPDIPFVSLEDIIVGHGITNLQQILSGQKVNSLTIEQGQGNPANLLEVIEPELTFIDLEVKSQGEALQFLSQKLEEKGYVKKGFYQSVMDREAMGPTLFTPHIVVPHGRPEYVKKPSIAIGILKNRIKWSHSQVKAVVLLALNEDCISIVQNIHDLLQDRKKVQSLFQVQNYRALYHLLDRHIKEA